MNLHYPREFRPLLGLAVILIAGCETATTLPPPETSPQRGWQQRLIALAGFDRWQCVGRVGVNDGNEAFSASLRWEQVRDSYEIRLSGPLGQGLAHVVGTPGGVALRTAEEGTRVAPTAESLLEQAVGWPLPVSGLRYWILGITVPDTPVEALELDAWGRPALLAQSGWRIRYQEYTRLDGVDLPVRIELEHAPISARISVSRWQSGS